jgi:peptidoglycan/LPS O-acetylase OafA/YrhL
VQLFFVLSGFLITRILLRSKQVDAPRQYFTVFYGRRVLRIFPVYYLYLFAVEGVYWAVTGLGLRPGEPLACFHDQWGYGLTYTMDFFHGSSGYVFTRLLSHFWSLAVEEQFYLLWPLVIWLVPERHTNRFLWGVVAAGPVLRFATLRIHGVEGIGTWMYWDASLALYVLPWSHFDAFATGALLSRIQIKRPRLGLGAMVVLVPLAGMAGGYAATGSVGPLDTMGYPLRLEHSGM